MNLVTSESGTWKKTV